MDVGPAMATDTGTSMNESRQADCYWLAPWTSRLKAAHFNAVENLVVFATGFVCQAALGLQLL